jgi:ELWxxDGT repeat protein
MRILSYLFLLLFAAGDMLAQTATLLKDINPGLENSSPSRFFQYGNQLLFRASTPDEGVELWVSDGTQDGTMLLKDINTDATVSRGNSSPDEFIEYKGKVYFKAKDATNGTELWMTDGTADGTMMVKDIQEGSGNGNPFNFIIFNDLLYFTANDGVNSSELWATDGTADGTAMVVDINPGNAPGNPLSKTIFQDKLFFTGNDGTNGAELWMSDGTVEGTSMVKDIRDGGNSLPNALFVANDLLYFRANNGMVGTELWTSDGTEEGTVLVADIREGTGSSSPTDFFQVGASVLFVANDGDGKKLFAITSDNPIPTPANLNPGEASNPREITEVIKNELYLFVADTSNTVEGTSLFLAAEFDDELDVEEYDDLLTNLGGFDIDDLVWTGNSLYFSYDSDETGRELATVGLVDENDITAFTEIVGGPTGAAIDDIFLFNNQLIFEANDTVTGREVWTAQARTAYVSLVDDAGRTLVAGDTLDFGGETPDFSSTRTVTFANTGNGNSLFLFELFDFSEQEFTYEFPTLDEDDFLPSAPNEAVMEFTFTPSALGDFIDTISVSFLTASGPNEVTFFLRGRGVAPEYTVSEGEMALTNQQSTLLFTDVEANTDSTRTLTLENTGEGVLVINSSSLTTGTVFSVVALDDTVFVGGTLEIPVTYSPTDIATDTDELVISTQAGDFFISLEGMSIVNAVIDRGLPTTAFFPNPTSDRVKLELAAPLNEGNWRIISSAGRVVSSGVWPSGQRQHEFDLAPLPTGIYQVEVVSGNRKVTARVMKQ